MRKRIFGCNLYITFEGKVEDVDGNEVVTKKLESGKYYVDIGKNRRRTICKLVAEAFIGPYNSGKKIVFLDGDKSNCAAYNLEYTNVPRCASHSYYVSYNTLTPEKIAEIIASIRKGIAIDDVADTFKMPKGLIHYILSENNRNIRQKLDKPE